jgi:cholesterol transport system auxiliary component
MVGCGSLQPAARPLLYDFGPGERVAPAGVKPASLPPLALSAVESTNALDTTAVLYRLAYSDAQQLRPYALARWTMPPAELLRQRLRERLGQTRVVLQSADGVNAPAGALTLRLEVEEFSHVFDAPDKSAGLLRLRATVAKAGGNLVAQRSFVVQRESTSADAPGGVRALTAAADAVIADIDQWLQQMLAPAPAASPILY